MDVSRQRAEGCWGSHKLLALPTVMDCENKIMIFELHLLQSPSCCVLITSNPAQTGIAQYTFQNVSSNFSVLHEDCLSERKKCEWITETADVVCVNEGSSAFLSSCADSVQGPNQGRLLSDLLKGYNVLDRPVLNETDTLPVELHLNLMQIIDLVRWWWVAALWPGVTVSTCPIFNQLDFLWVFFLSCRMKRTRF